MAETQKLGSVKRFGSRYGRTAKRTFAQIEKSQRSLHKCPYCRKVSVKRLAAGIWKCKRCDAKFTGKAYSISEPVITEEDPLPKEEEDSENG
jgi:large subunit ribosomal protein L37Ae